MGTLRIAAAISTLAMLATLCGAVFDAAATVHGPETCWDPDVEFPVPCNDDDD